MEAVLFSGSCEARGGPDSEAGLVVVVDLDGLRGSEHVTRSTTETSKSHDVVLTSLITPHLIVTLAH
jgi:hypothetical protein